jgi:hypothetical protein
VLLVHQSFGLKHFLGAFVVCALVYFVAYSGIEHLRYRNGPWQITFTTATNAPAIVINQPALKIRNLKIIFPSATTTNSDATLVFNQARPVPFDVPLGQCVFLDATTLPGTVALKIFDHEIQLLPRVLTIDGEEKSWHSDTTISLPKAASR